MDLFDYMREKNMEQESPLASRMRPTTLDEVVGQEHIIGKDKLLYRAIRADKLSSIIFYGPPGTGKTTLATVIAHTTKTDPKGMLHPFGSVFFHMKPTAITVFYIFPVPLQQGHVL